MSSSLQKTKHYQQRLIKLLGHDLKQPLSVMKIALYYLKKNSLPPQLKYLKKIENQVDELATALSDLADVERAFGEGIQVGVEFFSLQEVIEEVCLAFEQTHKCPVRFKAHSKVTQAVGDATKTKQALVYLLNGLSYLSNPTPEISILLKQIRATQTLEFTVKLEKIDPDLSNRFFELFALDQSAPSESKVPNMGLGLFLTKHIILAQQGTISVQVKPRSKLCVKVALKSA